MLESRVRLVVALLLITVFVLLVAHMTAERMPSASIPTPDLDQVRTEAVRTHIAELTSTATVRPSPGPTASPIPSPSPVTAVTGTPNCHGLRFIRDVSIPDNTSMTPAEVFTKTWLVENSGTCPWKPGFQVPYDQCRWQIIGKLPFPDTRDRLTKARMERDPEYGAYLTMQSLVQASGRGTRAPNDSCVSFLIDDSAFWFDEEVRAVRATLVSGRR